MEPMLVLYKLKQSKTKPPNTHTNQQNPNTQPKEVAFQSGFCRAPLPGSCGTEHPFKDLLGVPNSGVQGGVTTSPRKHTWSHLIDIVGDLHELVLGGILVTPILLKLNRTNRTR